MKKILSILSLVAILGLTTPAFAAPHGGHGGHHSGHAGGHRIHAGAHHRPHMTTNHHRHHGGIMIHTGYPRHTHWRCYRHGIRMCPWCYDRLGFYNNFYGPMIPMGGMSFSIGF